MPRKTRTTEVPAPPAVPALEEFVADCIAALPFDPDAAPDAPHLFANLSAPDGADFDGDAVRVAIAASIARDRAAGFSGNDLRAKYAGPAEAHGKGRGLTGPRRREVLRKYGFGSLVARSYVAYSDGDARTGSAHARMHGAKAADRAAADAALVAAAEEEAKEANVQAVVAGTDLRAMRSELRDAGRKVPTVRGGDETALRTAYADLLRETAS